MSKKKTIWILIGFTLLLIVWDIYAFVSPDEETISRVILDFAQEHPVFAFMFGVLVGHLFWPQYSRVHSEI